MKKQKTEQFPFTCNSSWIFFKKEKYIKHGLNEEELGRAMLFLKIGYLRAQKDLKEKGQKLMDKYGI